MFCSPSWPVCVCVLNPRKVCLLKKRIEKTGGRDNGSKNGGGGCGRRRMPTEKEEEGSARLSDAASSFRFQMFSIGAIVPLPLA